MSTILEAFLSFGLIESIEGDDAKYSKIEKASEHIAEKLRDEPQLIIEAVLAGVNSNVSSSLSIIQLAAECIKKEWKSVSSVFTDEPINLYRGTLLQACELIYKEKNNASIIWLTVCDLLPELALGKEREAVFQLLEKIALTAEKNALNSEPNEANFAIDVPKVDFQPKGINIEQYGVNKLQYMDRVGGAAGPNYRDGKGQAVEGHNPNGYWPNNHQYWSYDFTERMSDFLVEEFNRVFSGQGKLVQNINLKMRSDFDAFSNSVQAALNQQGKQLQQYQRKVSGMKTQEQTKLDVLWWSEALYSESLKDSYRAFSPELSSLVMSYDLVSQVAIPTPASVAYTLSETVNKLADCGFDKKSNFFEIVTLVRKERETISADFIKNLKSKPSDQTLLNIRDLVVLALTEEHCDLKELVTNSIISQSYECSLPELSRAVFRQEQAYRLATGG